MYARQNWLSPIKLYAFPIIGDLLLGDIRVEHITAVIEALNKGGVAESAKRVRARIEAALAYAVRKGWRDPMTRNPAETGFHPLPKRKGDRPHYRRIALDNAPAVFRELRERAGRDTRFAIWVFTIATAARPGEAVGAQWSEIDFDKKLWTVPAARMKSEREHVVPLSSIAIEVLERQATVRAGDAVFPGPSGSPYCYSAFASAPKKTKINAGAPHGWRSVFRDWAGDIGDIARDTAEAALAHSLSATPRALIAGGRQSRNDAL
jgi:integrase